MIVFSHHPHLGQNLVEIPANFFFIGLHLISAQKLVKILTNTLFVGLHLISGQKLVKIPAKTFFGLHETSGEAQST